MLKRRKLAGGRKRTELGGRPNARLRKKSASVRRKSDVNDWLKRRSVKSNVNVSAKRRRKRPEPNVRIERSVNVKLVRNVRQRSLPSEPYAVSSRRRRSERGSWPKNGKRRSELIRRKLRRLRGSRRKRLRRRKSRRRKLTRRPARNFLHNEHQRKLFVLPLLLVTPPPPAPPHGLQTLQGLRKRTVRSPLLLLLLLRLQSFHLRDRLRIPDRLL